MIAPRLARREDGSLYLIGGVDPGAVVDQAGGGLRPPPHPTLPHGVVNVAKVAPGAMNVNVGQPLPPSNTTIPGPSFGPPSSGGGWQPLPPDPTIDPSTAGDLSTTGDPSYTPPTTFVPIVSFGPGSGDLPLAGVVRS